MSEGRYVLSQTHNLGHHQLTPQQLQYLQQQQQQQMFPGGQQMLPQQQQWQMLPQQQQGLPPNIQNQGGGYGGQQFQQQQFPGGQQFQQQQQQFPGGQQFQQQQQFPGAQQQFSQQQQFPGGLGVPQQQQQQQPGLQRQGSFTMPDGSLAPMTSQAQRRSGWPDLVNFVDLEITKSGPSGEGCPSNNRLQLLKTRPLKDNSNNKPQLSSSKVV